MIEARGLAKTFKTRKRAVQAVRGVDLHVDAGEVVGFLGPNGAGKTTTLRMLTTLLEPTAGEATVAGVDLLRDPRGVRRRIGYVAQVGGGNPSSRVEEEIVLQARLHRISLAEAGERARELLPALDLQGLENRPLKTLSGGQRRRLDIALGLVHRPPLIFLDEPTTGLDPQSRSNMWGHIRRLRDEFHTTVFLTTHYLEEADALCDRILVIDAGSIVAEGTPDELKRRVSGDVVTVTVSRDVEKVAAALGALAGVREIAVPDAGEGGRLRLTVDDGERALPEVLRTVDGVGVPLQGLAVHRPTLDDVFLSLTGRSLREESD